MSTDNKLEFRAWLKDNPEYYIKYVFRDDSDKSHCFPAQKFMEFKQAYGDIFLNYSIHRWKGGGDCQPS